MKEIKTCAAAPTVEHGSGHTILVFSFPRWDSACYVKGALGLVLALLVNGKGLGSLGTLAENEGSAILDSE